MDLALDPALFLALLGAVLGTFAAVVGHRGATAAPRADLRRTVASAARRFRLRWCAMRSVAHDEIAGELHRATVGGAVLSPWLARFALDSLGAPVTAGPDARTDTESDAPTPAEHEVLLLVASGYSYAQIAERLQLSVRTIERHVSTVLRKLQHADRDER